MQQIAGINKLGTNKYCLIIGPKYTILFFSVIFLVFGIGAIMSYINSLEHKDKNGKNLTWTTYIITLLIGLFDIISSFILLYAYIYLN